MDLFVTSQFPLPKFPIFISQSPQTKRKKYLPKFIDQNIFCYSLCLSSLNICCCFSVHSPCSSHVCQPFKLLVQSARSSSHPYVAHCYFLDHSSFYFSISFHLFAIISIRIQFCIFLWPKTV